MVTHPSQLMLSSLLGLLAVCVMLAALYLLYRAGRPSILVVHDETAGTPPGTAATETRRSGLRRAMALLLPLLMLLWVFAGKALVAPFFPAAGEDRPLPPATATTIRGASGAELAVSHYGPRDGPTLVMTHGWGADQRDWAWLLRSLPQQFHVVLWDLPGLGASSRPRGNDYAMSTLAADLDSVVSSVGGKPVVLVGHSIGGILNLEYARLYPQKLGREVSGIVQANTTYTNPLATKKGAERSLLLQKPVLEPFMHVVSWASPVFRALGWFAYRSGLAHLQLARQSFAGAQSWEQLDEMARFAYRSSPDVVARGVLGMVNWDGSQVLPKVAVPTLIISGDQDVTTLPAASDRMSAIFRTPREHRSGRRRTWGRWSRASATRSSSRTSHSGSSGGRAARSSVVDVEPLRPRVAAAASGRP